MQRVQKQSVWSQTAHISQYLISKDFHEDIRNRIETIVNSILLQNLNNQREVLGILSKEWIDRQFFQELNFRDEKQTQALLLWKPQHHQQDKILKTFSKPNLKKFHLCRDYFEKRFSFCGSILFQRPLSTDNYLNHQKESIIKHDDIEPLW